LTHSSDPKSNAHDPISFATWKYFEALFEEAKLLGVFPLKDPLEGVDVDIRLAQVLNVQIPARKTRNRSLTPTFPT